MIQDTEQLSFDGVTCGLRQKPVFTHPKDAEIKALYLSGKSLREVGIALGISRSVVEYSCERQGITRDPPKSTVLGREDEVLALARLGYGFKAIGKRLGVHVAAVAVKSLLKRHGIKHGNRGMSEQPRTQKLWGIADIVEGQRAEREYEAAITRAYTPKITQMQRYYADHANSKARSAANARKRHERLKNTPEWKAKQFARNQLARIKRQVMQNQKSKRTHEYLGCTYKHAAQHITAQLKDGWTWDNYGIAWEIDHIVQLSDVDLLDAEQMARVCHYTNLRPLAVTDNRSRPRGLLAWQRKQQGTAA